MIDEGAARRAVEATLAEWPPPAHPDERIVIWQVEEHTRAWVVRIATRRWIRTRDFSDQLVGSSPFVVDKANGHVHQYGSAPDEFAKFTAWLDDRPDPTNP